MTLPLECVSQVVGYLEVDEEGNFCPSALYKLLTVNKTFFHAAAARLYWDPIKTLAACKAELEPFQNFLLLTSNITPSDNYIIRDLGYFLSYLYEPRSKHTIDYFRYVRVMRFRSIVDEMTRYISWPAGPGDSGDNDDSLSSSSLEEEKEHPELWGAILEAVCDHHLPNIRSISIPSTLLPRYLDMADQMLSVEEIEILFNDDPQEFETDEHIVEGLRDAQKLAKKLMDFAADKNHPRHATTLDIQLRGRPYAPEWTEYKSILESLYRLLPKSYASTISHGDDISNWVRFFMVPEQFDLPSVKAIRQWEPHNSPLKTSGFGARAPDTGLMDIIQQCRNLRTLHIALDQWEWTDIFAWARTEKEEALAAIKAGQPVSRPPIQLQHLELYMELDLSVSQEDIVRDVMFAFSSTLQSFAVYSDMGIDFSVFQNLPELRRLVTGVLEYSRDTRALLDGCRKLEVLEVHDADTGNPHSSFGLWDLPCLRILELSGDAVWKFNGASWESMVDSLEKLSLKSRLGRSAFTRLPMIFSWRLWPSSPFTRLHEVFLAGAPAGAFKLSMLVHCPAIRTLTMEVPVPASQANFQDRVGDLTLLRQHPLPLTSLTLRGDWITTEEFMMETLPFICPKLKWLYVICKAPYARGDFTKKLSAKFENLCPLFSFQY